MNLDFFLHIMLPYALDLRMSLMNFYSIAFERFGEIWFVWYALFCMFGFVCLVWYTCLVGFARIGLVGVVW